MVFSVLWPKGQQVRGIILLDTVVHHLVSKALPAQEFPNYRPKMGSQRAGPVKSLLYGCSSQVLLHVTGTLQAQNLVSRGVSSKSESYPEVWYTV